MEFRCNKCKYRFTAQKMPERCNYCGDKKGLVADENANELLKDI